MTKTYLTLSAAMLCAAMPPAVFAQSTDSETITATAEIVDAERTLNVSVVNNIEFGEVARPTLPGSVCYYEFDPLFIGQGYEVYANGSILEAPLGGVCTDFSNTSPFAGGIDIECAPNERVTVTATFNNAGVPGVSFDDGGPDNDFFFPMFNAEDDADGNRDFDGQATYFCEDRTQFGQGGELYFEVGGRLGLTADAALGVVEAGSVTIEATYE